MIGVAPLSMLITKSGLVSAARPRRRSPANRRGRRGRCADRTGPLSAVASGRKSLAEIELQAAIKLGWPDSDPQKVDGPKLRIILTRVR
jgi:hypothetical protein